MSFEVIGPEGVIARGVCNRKVEKALDALTHAFQSRASADYSKKGIGGCLGARLYEVENLNGKFLRMVLLVGPDAEKKELAKAQQFSEIVNNKAPVDENALEIFSPVLERKWVDLVENPIVNYCRKQFNKLSLPMAFAAFSVSILNPFMAIGFMISLDDRERKKSLEVIQKYNEMKDG
ncbi:MAG: hypothetical protein N3G22_03510 [Candidatus Micrarchaeota archaeon]|nr:hypothetical protein [Candidatus Micrarchaeota archaeon]